MDRREFMAVTAGALAGSATTSFASRLPQPAANGAAVFDTARRFVETRHGRIACVDRGRGDAALFLHGFPLSAFQWRGAIDKLAGSRRCIAPDFMGLGHTVVARGQSVTPHAQVEMLVTLLDSLRIPRVDLVASDSGGAVAQLLVVEHPSRVRSLLLTNCDAEIDSPPPALLPVIEMARAGTFADGWLGTWLADKALARSAEGIGGMCYTDPDHPTDAAIEDYFKPVLSSPERKALVHAYAVALEHNPLAGIEAKLRQSPVPTRIVWGTSDTIFSPKSPGYLAGVFGNSKGVRELPGRKLFWPEELPAVVAAEARRLWDGR